MEWKDWVVIVEAPILGALFWMNRQLSDALDAHKEEDGKFHIDIVQNVIPNAIDKLAARMDSRFDRIEDKIDHRS